MSTSPIRSTGYSVQEDPLIKANPEPAERLEKASDNPLFTRNISQIFSHPTNLESNVENDQKKVPDVLKICPTDYLGEAPSDDPRREFVSSLVSLMH